MMTASPLSRVHQYALLVAEDFLDEEQDWALQGDALLW